MVFDKRNLGLIGIIFLAVVVFAVLYTVLQDPLEDENGCFCPEVWDPVCGVDGKTYGNACFAECEGVEIAHEGECKDDTDCICPTLWEPVCGVDGKTYSNACYAECADVEIAHEGECGEEMSESELEEKLDSFLEEKLSELEKQEGKLELPLLE